MLLMKLRWSSFRWMVRRLTTSRVRDRVFGFSPFALRQARGGRTILEIAVLAGVEPGLLRAFETWGTRPTPAELRRISDVLDVDPLTLVAHRRSTPWLWLLRVRRGIDAEVLANDLGVTTDDLRRIEGGVGVATTARISDVATSLDVAPEVVAAAVGTSSHERAVVVAAMVPGWFTPRPATLTAANWFVVVGIAGALAGRLMIAVAESGTPAPTWGFPVISWVGLATAGVGAAVYLAMAIPIVRFVALVASCIVILVVGALVEPSEAPNWLVLAMLLVLIALTLTLMTCAVRASSIVQYVVESVRQQGESTAQRTAGWASVLLGTAMLVFASRDCDTQACTGPSSVLARFLGRPPVEGPELANQFGVVFIGLGLAAVVDLFGRQGDSHLRSAADALDDFITLHTPVPPSFPPVLDPASTRDPGLGRPASIGLRQRLRRALIAFAAPSNRPESGDPTGLR